MRTCLDCGALKSRHGDYCKPCGYKHRKGTGFQKGHPFYTGAEKGWFKQGQSSWLKGKRGPEVPGWKGDQVSYDALHAWVEYYLGKPKECENCGINDALRFDWANKSGEYKRDLNDWLRLCRKCHVKYDYQLFGARRIFYVK